MMFLWPVRCKSSKAVVVWSTGDARESSVKERERESEEGKMFKRQLTVVIRKWWRSRVIGC